MDPPDRRGALVSTKQIGTPQTDISRYGALASTNTNLGPTRQTHIDVVHRQAHNRFAPLQKDTGRHKQTWCRSKNRTELELSEESN